MEACPGCGTRYERAGLPPSTRHLASGECLAAYHALTLRTLALGDAAFVHQHAVDAYAAGHAGGPSKPVTVWFALAGLCLALEHGLTGREVQLIHMRMARGDRQWPTFVPPVTPARTTVLDAREDDLHPWMEDVWASWAHEQDRIRTLAGTVLRHHAVVGP